MSARLLVGTHITAMQVDTHSAAQVSGGGMAVSKAPSKALSSRLTSVYQRRCFSTSQNDRTSATKVQHPVTIQPI